MIYIVAFLVASSVGLFTVALVQYVEARSAPVARGLDDLRRMRIGGSGLAAGQRERQTRREKWRALLQQVGEQVEKHRTGGASIRQLLSQAGFRGRDALSVYWGARVALPLALMALPLALIPVVGGRGLLLAFAFGGLGWILPSFYLGARIRRRKKELQKAIPDALDALVVCVEAGLGLNQAIVRVADEIRHVSTLMSEELILVNLEIRAGTAREDALRNLGERTGMEDIRSLVAMLIQTDRFGTSIAQALRVQSDTLRTKRRQRAEEAAAKTAIKMLFPLVFFILPALFVIVLGPGVLQLVQAFQEVRF
jgi:tight adherence protein C